MPELRLSSKGDGVSPAILAGQQFDKKALWIFIFTKAVLKSQRKVLQSNWAVE
jgi:hypothetical protein